MCLFVINKLQNYSIDLKNYLTSRICYYNIDYILFKKRLEIPTKTPIM